MPNAGGTMSASDPTHEPNPTTPSPLPVLAQLATLRDVVRVRAHLAARDAQDALQQIDDQLGLAEKALRRAMRGLEQRSDEAEVQMHLAWLEARERLERVAPALRDLARGGQVGGRGATESAAETWDSARLQAHLAAMDAADAWQFFLEQRRRAFQASLRDARAEGEKAARDLLDWLKELRQRWASDQSD